MKKIFLMMVILITSITQMYSAPKVSGEISFTLARPKFDCKKGFWFCNVKGGVKMDGVIDDLVDRLMLGMVTDNGDGTVKIEFQNQLAENGNFYAERGEEVELPKEISKAMGYNTITLIPGNYTVQSNGKYGFVIVRIKTT